MVLGCIGYIRTEYQQLGKSLAGGSAVEKKLNQFRSDSCALIHHLVCGPQPEQRVMVVPDGARCVADPHRQAGKVQVDLTVFRGIRSKPKQCLASLLEVVCRSKGRRQREYVPRIVAILCRRISERIDCGSVMAGFQALLTELIPGPRDLRVHRPVSGRHGPREDEKSDDDRGKRNQEQQFPLNNPENNRVRAPFALTRRERPVAS
jgi:hypothetical protein